VVFSYDNKLWRTLHTLIRHPGLLTLEYYEGKRAGYLSPFQIFFWLQAIAFAANTAFFSRPEQTEATSRLVMGLGCCIVLVLALVHHRRQPRFLFHLVATVHIWAFLMLVLLAAYPIVPAIVNLLVKAELLTGTIQTGLIVTTLVEVAIVIYMTVAIHRIYNLTWLRATVQTISMLVGFMIITHYLK
jgi:hypothetical protein